MFLWCDVLNDPISILRAEASDAVRVATASAFAALLLM